MIACLGETTGELALQEQLKIMKTKEEGLEILDDRPRINSQTIDFEKLKYMDKESFGHVYWIFLRDNVSKTLKNANCYCNSNLTAASDTR